MKLTLEQLNENYTVSSCGKVFSKRRYGSKGGELNQFVVKGYRRVTIYCNGVKKAMQVHRLVAKLFVPNIENKPCVNHKDGNKLNNNYTNLEWVTVQENSQHAYTLGLSNSASTGKFGYDAMRSKEVHQHNKDGIYLQSFGSVREASRITNTNLSSISMCINNKLKTAGGYKWKQN